MATYIEKWNTSDFRFGVLSQWWIAIVGSQACHSIETRNEAHSPIIFYFALLSVYKYATWVWVSAKVSVFLALELQMVVSCLKWVSGTMLGALWALFTTKPGIDSVSSSRGTLEKWNQANSYMQPKSKSNDKFLWKFHLSIHCHICYYVLMDQDKRLFCLFSELPVTKEMLGSRLGGKVTLLLPVCQSSA